MSDTRVDGPITWHREMERRTLTVHQLSIVRRVYAVSRIAKRLLEKVVLTRHLYVSAKFSSFAQFCYCHNYELQS